MEGRNRKLFCGAGYMNQQGIEPAQSFKRYSIKQTQT